MPPIIQKTPKTSVDGFSAVTTTQAMNGARAADECEQRPGPVAELNVERSEPGPVPDRKSRRILITEMCAIVKLSSAPKA